MLTLSSSMFSGCHCTPIAFQPFVTSIPSITPSDDLAVICKSLPSFFIAWWWIELTFISFSLIILYNFELLSIFKSWICERASSNGLSWSIWLNPLSLRSCYSVPPLYPFNSWCPLHIARVFILCSSADLSIANSVLSLWSEILTVFSSLSFP